MPEIIEHNASIIGTTLVQYYKFLFVKIHITGKDRYTLIEQFVTVIEQWLLGNLQILDLVSQFCSLLSTA